MKYLISILLFPIFICCAQETPKPIEVTTPKPFDDTKNNTYTWNSNYETENKLINRITVPEGFERVKTEAQSYADWLRHIPLFEGKPDVLLYNGNLKGNQSAHYAVLDIDIGTRDLQQCADAVMRLRAEYLFANKKYDKIAFNFTSGDKCSFKNWAEGERPVINGNKVSFVKQANKDYSYANFKKYMNIIFTYCGTFSLEKELNTVSDIKQLKAGDVFIMGGFPGHAVNIMDVAINTTTNEKLFLLSQSYMPAQNIHILKNPSNKMLSPWFSCNFDGNLVTPEWTFQKIALKSF